MTVFIPVYNGEPFIRSTIHSVLAQTYADYELLIVDDGSTDGTADILRSVADPRIRLARNEVNRGRPYTRNRGVGLARGEYIAVLDADDLSEPTRLQRQVEFLDAHPEIACVGSHAIYVNRDETRQLLCQPPTRPDDIRRHIYQANCFVHSSVTFRRAVLLNIGGYSADYPQSQDYELFLRLCGAYPLANLPEPLVRYRVHPGQVSFARLRAQRRLADQARVAAYRAAAAADHLLPGTHPPETSTIARLLGKRGTCGRDYLDWSFTYRALGEPALADALVFRSLLYAPLSRAGWRELRTALRRLLRVDPVRNRLRWYGTRIARFLKGSVHER
ncbi:MAG: glycosyltransferase family 2 protein [Gammaproteobacteria bacterium]